MGSVLTIPISFIIDYFFDIKISELTQVDKDRGIWFWLKYIVAVLLMKILKRSYKKDLCNYSMDCTGTAEDLGISSSKLEWSAEASMEFSSTSKYVDDGIFFYGGNSRGDCVIVNFIKKNSGMGEIFLFLKIADKGCYALPPGPDIKLPNDHSKIFSAVGLEIRCLSPFRRWRISYNGLLREINNDECDGVHVKFSFIWKPTNCATDLQTNQSSFLLAEAVAAGDWKFLQTARRIFDKLHRYEHWGQYSGTVSIADEPELEMYCWGIRSRERSLFSAKHNCHSTRLYGYSVDGFIFHIGAFLSSGINQKYILYGYIILPSRTVVPIHKIDATAWEEKMNTLDYFELQFLAGKKFYCISVQKLEIKYHSHEDWEQDVRKDIRMMKFKFCSTQGHGIIVNTYRNPEKIKLRKPKLMKAMADNLSVKNVPMVLELNEECCQNTAISGGKGSSLSRLIQLKNNMNKESSQKFLVPPGIVVTTSAYQYHLKIHRNICESISDIYNRQSNDNNDISLKERCNRVVTEFCSTSLDDILAREIGSKMPSLAEHTFGKQKYAVRSSGVGEDGADLSLAGQMDTILGVDSFDEVCAAIVKCWSSQFSFPAIQYKRQTGQPLDSGMAVIVQEMVSSEISGVMFTCDPVTHNPGYITITANYGLGESVVSALAEPDMLKLHRSLNGTVSFHSQKIGSKELQINVKDGGKVQEENKSSDKMKCCLSEKQALYLANIGVYVEQCFGKLQDIEWAIVGETVYLLQARPVTTYNVETEFELCHEMDSGLLAEFEYCTTANVGEVMPGAMSPLSMSTTVWALDLPIKLLTKIQEGRLPSEFNWTSFQTVLACQHRIFFNMLDFVLAKNERKETITSSIWEVCLLGRLLKEEIGKEMKQRAIERYGHFSQVRKTLGLLTVAWVAYKIYGKTRKMKEKYSHYEISYQKYQDCSELYKLIQGCLPDLCEIANFHVLNSFLSSVFTTFILSILGDGQNAEKLFAKFSQLLSNCNDVKSADVSLSLRDIAITIAEQKKSDLFVKLSSKEAYDWLINDDSPSGRAFNEFMQSHGYRCIKEYDLYSQRWEEQPYSLISCLQNMLKGGKLERRFHKTLSVKEAVDELGLSLGFLSRKFLEVFTSWGRHGVRAREESKALMVKSLNAFRQSYMHLGKLMTSENKLPDAELIFFLTHDEISEVINEQCIHLVHKAIQRRKLFRKMDKFSYPEIISGPPKQIDSNVQHYEYSNTKLIKGTPASKGSAEGIARVVLDVDEASSIKNGDILITNSTDVGWTPYFPLLSGVVTQLGGLISHGAVVAREYGLPCIVGAKGAIQCFKSGDHVFIDGTNGILKLIE